jgi:hypothetical protein
VIFWNFRVGDVFPADDVLAEWVATLSMAFNDLSLVAKRLDEPNMQQHETFYFQRLLIAHVTETCVFLYETKDIPEVRAFVNEMPEDAQRMHADALRMFKARKAELHAIRSHVFHYPELKSQPNQKKPRLMQRVLKAHADTETVAAGGRVRDSRMLFADDLAAELLAVNSGGEERFRAVHEEISRGYTPLSDFLIAVVDTYFRRRADSGAHITRVEPLDPDDWSQGWKEV